MEGFVSDLSPTAAPFDWPPLKPSSAHWNVLHLRGACPQIKYDRPWLSFDVDCARIAGTPHGHSAIAQPGLRAGGVGQ
jgi:hypothetical protein